MRTLLEKPLLLHFTPAFESTHSGKQRFCGIPGSRTVTRIGAQGMFAEWIDEFMKTVCYVTLPKDTEMFVPLLRLRFLYVLYHRSLTSSNNRPREDSWLKSLFVRKVDPRKDAHSNLLAKKETSSLYKLQCE